MCSSFIWGFDTFDVNIYICSLQRYMGPWTCRQTNDWLFKSLKKTNTFSLSFLKLAVKSVKLKKKPDCTCFRDGETREILRHGETMHGQHKKGIWGSEEYTDKQYDTKIYYFKRIIIESKKQACTGKQKLKQCKQYTLLPSPFYCNRFYFSHR